MALTLLGYVEGVNPMQKDARAVRIRDGHDNFFTPLRLVFAVLVMLGHAFVIALRDASQEPQVFFHYTFSYLAVNLFFVASGFLVTKSMLYRGDGAGFAAARILRIFPALALHVAVVLLIVGPLATSLPLLDYFTHPDTLMQPLWVLTFFETNMSLPGIFETNAEQYGSVPLWTLRFEVLCYIGTLAAFALGLLRRKWMVLAQFVVPSVLWIVGQSFGLLDDLPGTILNLLRFGIAYGLGATIFAYSERLQFTWAALPVLLGACWLLSATPVIEVTMNLLMAWLVMFVAYARVPKLGGLQTLDDVSYGIYIYHWAVMQLVFYWLPELSVWSLFGLALPVTVAIAWASWIYVEKPMLTKKTAFAAWLRRGRAPRDYNRDAVLLD